MDTEVGMSMLQLLTVSCTTGFAAVTVLDLLRRQVNAAAAHDCCDEHILLLAIFCALLLAHGYAAAPKRLCP